MKRPNGYWTRDRVIAAARKFTNRTAFKTDAPSAYQTATRRGWLEEVCAHMEPSQKRPNGYWTIERCAAEALKYGTRGEFCRADQTAYQAARHRGWLDDICAHMTSLNGWTRERAAQAAKKYRTRDEFV